MNELPSFLSFWFSFHKYLIKYLGQANDFFLYLPQASIDVIGFGWVPVNVAHVHLPIFITYFQYFWQHNKDGHIYRWVLKWLRMTGPNYFNEKAEMKISQKKSRCTRVLTILWLRAEFFLMHHAHLSEKSLGFGRCLWKQQATTFSPSWYKIDMCHMWHCPPSHFGYHAAVLHLTLAAEAFWHYRLCCKLSQVTQIPRLLWC